MLPIDVDANQTNLYANAVRDEKAGEVILKIVNSGETERTVQVNLVDLTTVAPEAISTVLTGEGRVTQIGFLRTPQSDGHYWQKQRVTSEPLI